ncbi:hypothetical protein CH296_11130 [Rhodococcus sp. 14-2496-1d]|uniref:hypothetical protein n=1 Tax=Rhodococcus sp. 14-2496-1d TaxID=2023146 RepID=UPI000B9C014F|nr:hypothetical protein [Rhodococcus sp. 14-2496-1d]OZF33181.1 hypothetical protein CH296_11130 [Rhodococcus sp. 14-2496-1d]
MSATPTIGRVVHYTASEGSADAINKRRATSGHQGNTVHAGDVFPATVVRVWPTCVNLQVQLDGTDTYWATSVYEGEGPHTWAWPTRA